MRRTPSRTALVRPEPDARRRRRGSTPVESLTLSAIVGAALVVAALILREERRFTSIVPLDRAALASGPSEWVSAAAVCAASLGCLIVLLRRLPPLDERFILDAFNPVTCATSVIHAMVRLDPTFELLSNPDTELHRMFGRGQPVINAAPAEGVHARDTDVGAPENGAVFRALVQGSPDTIFITGADAVIRFASASVQEHYGFRVDEVIGRQFADFIHEDDQRAVRRAWNDGQATRPGARFTLRCRVRDVANAWRHVEIAGVNRSDDDAVRGIVLHARDVSERTAIEAQLTHRAFHDGLTSLANRALFRDRIEHALARSVREKTPGVVVLFLDLDDFKSVNDTMGHAAGDQLLVAVATKLLNATRGSDTVARLGGDEFAILLENTRVDDEVLVVAKRLLASLNVPMLAGSRELQKTVRIGTSIGIARAQLDDTAETLLRNADLAMYKAKKAGKNRFEIFHQDMRLEVSDRRQLEVDLRNALVNGTEFHLAYQPIVDLASGATVGAEALVRWDHPERGLLAPGAFLPLAEESGLIVPLGRWILRDACRQAARWCAEEGQSAFNVSINLSAHQLREPTLPRDVEDALQMFGVEPSCITLEITESVIMADIDVTLPTLFALKELGVRLAIDDFGTGYSSLSCLRQFPIDVLKIDKTFVDGVARGGQHSALARTVMALADTLGLQTIAEGIEHASQRDALRKLGCHLGQGFLFAKPLPAQQISSVADMGSVSSLPAREV